MTDKTPDKGTGGRKNFDALYSPSSKRALDFDILDEESYSLTVSPPPKQQKLDSSQEGLLIKDLGSDSYVRELIKFRVTKFKYGQAGERGVMTLRFYAWDGSGEVLIVAWADVAERFVKFIKVDATCSLKNFLVFPEKPQYPSYSGHTHYVKLTSSSIMAAVQENLPKIPFNFIPIDQLSNSKVDDKTDILAVVGYNEKIDPERGTRRLHLTQGQKKVQVILTLFKDAAVEFGDDSNVVLAVRNATRKELEQKPSLEAKGCTLIWKNPEIEEAKALDPVVRRIDELRERVIARNSGEAEEET